MKIKHFLPLLLMCLSVELVAQQDTNGYFQISGLIISESTDESIPYVRIQVNHTRRGQLSNSDGFYSIPVTEDDTLYFTHVGFHPTTFVVRDYLRSYKGDLSQYIYVINYMLEDTFTLKPVTIFPYNTPEEIRTAVLNMDILEDSPEAFARRNLDPEVLDAIIQTLPKDVNERLLVARQLYQDQYQQRNLIPTAGLNPLAAMRLLQYVVEKSKKRKNKDLNYWE